MMARSSKEKKEQTRERIIAAAGRTFRNGGYSGIGVDGLAKEAGVTSGAFYGHFASKEEAFTEAVKVGLMELNEGIESFQTKYLDNWIPPFIDFYMGQKLTCDLADACSMPTLTPEVARSNQAVRQIYEVQISRIIDTIAKGLPHQEHTLRRLKAWTFMCLLSGGVATIRALVDEAMSTEAIDAIKISALKIVDD